MTSHPTEADAALGAGELREAIARIIDPDGFSGLKSEREWAAKYGKPDSFWLPWQERCNKVLAKADAILAFATPPAPGEHSEDEAYEIGKRDGYEDAIQTLDLATGGDGEFKGSTIPGATVDVTAMQARIIARLATPAQSEPVALREGVRALVDRAIMSDLGRQQSDGVKFLTGVNIDDLVSAVVAALAALASPAQQPGPSGDAAFEAYRTKKYGAYDAYPVEAYTHFIAGFEAALASPPLQKGQSNTSTVRSPE